jgi:thermostable 8-oxoguanine DNA glycosylase
MHQAESQTMLASIEGQIRSLMLPGPSEEVLPGVYWGAFDEFMTPAFWAGRAWVESDLASAQHYKLGSTLEEEVAACLLGGFGIPAEVGLAAFERLRDAQLLAQSPTADALWALLSEPLSVGGRRVRYRFARQKAEYLSRSLQRLDGQGVDRLGDLELREFLLALPGIGPKTASWITRNWRDSDAVAILDVHICRACTVAGVFPLDCRPERDYPLLETKYLEFARAIGVRPSVLDNIIWQTMRRLPAGGRARKSDQLNLPL